jgi:hypothetical protein
MARNKKYQSERGQPFISQGRELGCDEDLRLVFRLRFVFFWGGDMDFACAIVEGRTPQNVRVGH